VLTAAFAANGTAVAWTRLHHQHPRERRPIRRARCSTT
jgi:hypothetical protein